MRYASTVFERFITYISLLVLIIIFSFDCITSAITKQIEIVKVNNNVELQTNTVQLKQSKVNIIKSPLVTPEEIIMMEYVIQAEAGNGSLKHKIIIAQIILNRLKSNEFPNTVSDILHQKGQFFTINNYYSRYKIPDDETKLAVNKVINGECKDLTKGALYFYAPKYTRRIVARWFERDLDFVFKLEGHRFFR